MRHITLNKRDDLHCLKCIYETAQLKLAVNFTCPYNNRVCVVSVIQTLSLACAIQLSKGLFYLQL